VTVLAVRGLIMQVVLVAVSGLVLLLLALLLTRMGRLAIRYGLGWMGVGLLVVALSPLLGLVESVAGALGFTPTGFIVGIVVVFLVLLAVQLSISISGQQEAVRSLSESHALLERRLAETERRLAELDDQARDDG
jgi:hypothetical protein